MVLRPQGLEDASAKGWPWRAMEVSKLADATDEGDMGISHTNKISAMRGARRDHSVILERVEHICIGNAKVRTSFRENIKLLWAHTTILIHSPADSTAGDRRNRRCK